MLFSLHTTLTYVSFVQSLRIFQEHSSGATAPDQPFPDAGSAPPAAAPRAWRGSLRSCSLLSQACPQWNLTSSRQGLLSFAYRKVIVIVAQSCPTFWKPMDCSLPGSSFYGIFPGTLLEWVVISSPRGSSQPRDRTCVACIGRPILYH